MPPSSTRDRYLDMRLSSYKSLPLARAVQTLVFFLCVSCSQLADSLVARGETTQPIREFCGTSQMSIEVILGEGAAGSESGGGLRLFGGDLDRAEAFRGLLIRQISNELAAHEISVTDEASDILSVTIYGRPTGSKKCANEDVYLVVAYLFKDSPSPDLGTEGVTPEFGLRIGVCPQEELEEALTSSVLGILDDAWCK